jgi:hypothetical protein
MPASDVAFKTPFCPALGSGMCYSYFQANISHSTPQHSTKRCFKLNVFMYQISSGRKFMMNTRAQRTLLHTCITLVIVKQQLLQIFEIRGVSGGVPGSARVRLAPRRPVCVQVSPFPEPRNTETQNPKPEIFREGGTCTQFPPPETRNPKPSIVKPCSSRPPETRNPEDRNPKTEIRKPKTRKTGTRNPKSETREIDTRNSQGPNPKPETRNPKPGI